MRGHALDLAVLSEQAYDKISVRDGNVEAFIQPYHDGEAIVFRGTAKNKGKMLSRVRDIISDIRFWPSNDNELGRVPKGFKICARRINDEIEQHIVDKRTPLYVTGHSLGGAIAVMTAALLANRGYNVVGCITFGCPKVGHIDLIHKHGIPLVMYKNGKDVVTTVPPFYGRPVEQMRLSPSEGRFKDHSISRYVEALR